MIDEDWGGRGRGGEEDWEGRRGEEEDWEGWEKIDWEEESKMEDEG